MLIRVAVFEGALERGAKEAFFADVKKPFTGRFFHFITKSRSLPAGGGG